MNAEGQPLCAHHRLTRCWECHDLFPRREMQQRPIAKREDTHLRHGMRPREESVLGTFCPACYRKPDLQIVREAHGPPVVPIVILAVASLFGLLFILLFVLRPGG